MMQTKLAHTTTPKDAAASDWVQLLSELMLHAEAWIHNNRDRALSFDEASQVTDELLEFITLVEPSATDTADDSSDEPLTPIELTAAADPEIDIRDVDWITVKIIHNAGQDYIDLKRDGSGCFFVFGGAFSVHRDLFERGGDAYDETEFESERDDS